MWYAASAALAGAACIYASVIRLQRVRRLRDHAAEKLYASVNRPSRERLLALVATHSTDSVTVKLVRGALEAKTRDHAVAELNEVLTEVGGELDRGAQVPKSAARIALASSAVLAVVGIAQGLPRGAGSLVEPMVALGIGIAGALTCAQLGRSSERASRRQKDAINGIVRMTMNVVPGGDGPELARGRLTIG